MIKSEDMAGGLNSSRNITLGNNIHLMPAGQCALVVGSNPAVLQNYQSNQHSSNMVLHQQRPLQNVSSVKSPLQHIAPAPLSTKGTSQISTTVLGLSNSLNVPSQQQMCPQGRTYKKKYTYTNLPYGEQPPSVVRRNARERNRVKQVNNGFANLRQHIPQTIIGALSNGGRGASKKLSKVDTLRLAVEYIRRLKDLIDDGDSDAGSTGTVNHSQSSSVSTSSGASYYAGSPSHYAEMQSPTCSETSASPTPSYSSDLSIGNSNNYHNQQQPATGYNFEIYETYNGAMKPEDEELLDYISSWQEQ